MKLFSGDLILNDNTLEEAINKLEAVRAIFVENHIRLTEKHIKILRKAEEYCEENNENFSVFTERMVEEGIIANDIPSEEEVDEWFKEQEG